MDFVSERGSGSVRTGCTAESGTLFDVTIDDIVGAGVE
jgi:hypothetical protein